MNENSLKRTVLDILNNSESSHGQCSTSNVTLSPYLKATNRISEDIQNHDTKGLETVIRECSKIRFNQAPSSGNDAMNGDSDFRSDINESNLLHNDWNTFGFGINEEIEWQGPSSGQAATFTTRGQGRHGSTHGKGGRMPGSGDQVRKYYSKYARSVLYNRMFSLLTISEETQASSRHVTNNASNNCYPHSVEPSITVSPSATADPALVFCEKLLQGLSGRTNNTNIDIANCNTSIMKEKLLKELQVNAGDKIPTSVEHLPCCILGVTAKFSKSDGLQPSEGRHLNVRERHIVNTWLDKNGNIRCTCLGSTQYEILALNEEFHSPCCIHAEAFTETLNTLSQAVFGGAVIVFKVFYDAFAMIEPEIVDLDGTRTPMVRKTHGNRSAVFICKDASSNEQLCWIPIRKVQRGGGRYLCAFCDMINTNRCHHVKKVRNLCMGRTSHGEDVPSDLDGEQGVAESGNENNSNETSNRYIFKNHQPISTLPVGPVNCAMALRVDQEICDLVKGKGIFKLMAPPFCTYCNSPRIETTRSENTSGVIMCSIGACRMEVDTYICSGCRKQYSAEGKQQGVFVDSVCLAATQKLLRDQLIGFALGNGTLSSRLDRFHSEVTAFEDAKLFQNQVPCRSTRKLYDLCISFVRLMVCDPIVSLFCCPTCQGATGPEKKGNQGYSIPRALCVDGIWAGYLKKSAIPFENVSEACEPISSFSRSVKSTFHKPRTSFLRLDKTITFLMNAIKGKTIEVNCGSVNALVSAVRLVDNVVLPFDFYSTSICGTFPQDFKYDIGEGCLSKLRDLTCTLFHKYTLLFRLLEPLQKVFQRQGKRRKTGKSSSQNRDYCKAYDTVTRCIAHIMDLSEDEEGICWNEKVRAAAVKADCGMKLFQLFQALLQGPLTHLIRREEIYSALLVAEACIHYKPDDFLKAMVSKNSFSSSKLNGSSGDEEEKRNGANIIKNVRTLEGGLLSAGAVDSGALDDSTGGARLLPSFGQVIAKAVEIVSHFHSFYSEHVEKGGSTAAEYAKKWGSRNFSYLRDLFINLANSAPFQPNWGVDYDDPFVTGAYFPSLPQVRPLPFNDKNASAGVDVESTFGFCSKHYLQRNASFTPGAITFSCACAHPIVLGFKVLEKDEGPRAVLDVLLSRFPTLPRFIVYDFACGVYRSAISTLWWVVEDSTLVSDSFHGENHTCSPTFQPTAQVKLNMINTLSHEQRNRPIAKIKNSLQQTSQDVYISLLAYQVMVNNIEARARTAGDEQVPVQNRSAKDIEWAFFHRLQISCRCCEVTTSP